MSTNITEINIEKIIQKENNYKSYTPTYSAYIKSTCDKVSDLATKYIENGYQLYFIERHSKKEGYRYYPKLPEQVVEMDEPLPKNQIAVLIEAGKISTDGNTRVASHEVGLNGEIWLTRSPVFGSHYYTFHQILSDLHKANNNEDYRLEKKISVISTSTVEEKTRGYDYILVENSPSKVKKESSCVIS